jgi:hypothetical protein
MSKIHAYRFSNRVHPFFKSDAPDSKNGCALFEYERERFGKIKLTVGELRGSGQKMQYCITAIEND